jgi:hypothetical protein
MTPSSPPAVPNRAALPQLAATIVRLTELVERETAVLQTPGMPGFVTLQEEKGRLTQAYARSVAEIGTASGGLDRLAPRLRAEMHAAATRLAQALLRNEAALRATTEATDRVLGTIIRALKQQRVGSTNYAPRRSGAGRSTLPAGMTFDQRL